MKEQSIIFFDIDGTLLDTDKNLPESAKKAVARLKEDGHIVAIATGRAPFMYENLRKELDIDTFVSCNGQYVVLEGEVIYQNPLHREDLVALTEEALGNDHPVVYLSEENMMSNVPEHEYINEGIASLKLGIMPGHDPGYLHGRDLYQTLLFVPEGEEGQYIDKYDNFDFIRWHPVSMDVIPKGASKAEGIAKVIDELGLPAERQYAFGDGPNDLEMLSTVHHSFAMGNAKDEVKSKARHITKHVNDNGVEHGLRMAGLIQ
ncbi:phosphatase [Salinicoccus sediminis]|uniref:Phosphatase n=1 Tax=Salinicoccus sediminis TaxID=1432562 RepID=A0A0M2SF68_9STAP|nr:Cof-type HAD-IIB family hydrolase [Salinicoccus sediminis]KKK33364.1 phosphatase [Salinicoccus sediminis]